MRLTTPRRVSVPQSSPRLPQARFILIWRMRFVERFSEAGSEPKHSPKFGQVPWDLLESRGSSSGLGRLRKGETRLEEGQNRGCCGSTELAIVVPRRSWRKIFLWKT